jgi:hypothetical protein
MRLRIGAVTASAAVVVDDGELLGQQRQRSQSRGL